MKYKTLIPASDTSTGISLRVDETGDNYTVAKLVTTVSDEGKENVRVDNPAHHSNPIKALEDMAYREAEAGFTENDFGSYITILTQSLTLFKEEIKGHLGLS